MRRCRRSPPSLIVQRVAWLRRTSQGRNKKSAPIGAPLFCGRLGPRRALLLRLRLATLGLLELLALLLGALLQLFLQLLLGLFELLRVGRRTIVGLGEAAVAFLQRQRQRQRGAVRVDRLDV